jgi:protein-S-isoprenylcysteine O-methyltransferase Ste14
LPKIAAFIIISACLICISRASFRGPRSHGFYRFFAWELIVAMLLLNLDGWFHNPASWHQLLSWFLLTVSIVPFAFGVSSLTTKGGAVKHRADDEQLLGFEKTTNLVTTGIYHYIRHPLYSSLLILAWGIFFKSVTWPGALLVLAATWSLRATAKADEAECIRLFGAHYQAYMKRTKMFVPFLF